MGLDVDLFARGEITDEQLDAAQKLFAERSLLDTYSDGIPLGRTRSGAVERRTLMRYYAPGYERGNWPMIYNDIMLMRAAFPGATIYYQDDCNAMDYDAEATDERLAEMWAHWTGSRGKAYHR